MEDFTLMEGFTLALKGILQDFMEEVLDSRPEPS